MTLEAKLTVSLGLAWFSANSSMQSLTTSLVYLYFGRGVSTATSQPHREAIPPFAL